MAPNSVTGPSAIGRQTRLDEAAHASLASDVPWVLADWARRRPTANAVVADHRARTYAQLAADVARHSARLASAGVGPEVVLAAETLCAWACQICPAGCAILDIATERRVADSPPEPGPFGRRTPDSAAYVIQTSGSTGAPKSIQTQTGAISNLVEWYVGVCEMNSQSRVAQVVSANFDASVKNFLAPFVCGATLVLFPDIPYDPGRLLDFIYGNQITVLNCIPSMFYPVLEAARSGGFRQLSSVRVLVLGTETPDLGILHPWMQSEFFEARILNFYDPAECTIVSSYASIG
jgi:non-ribosomal peptide synthetase component F